MAIDIVNVPNMKPYTPEDEQLLYILLVGKKVNM